MVAHACNPSYQEAEIRRFKVQSYPQANSSGDFILKKSSQKKGLWNGLSGKECPPSLRARVQTLVPPGKKK
jgi:hypothetical protein